MTSTKTTLRDWTSSLGALALGLAICVSGNSMTEAQQASPAANDEVGQFVNGLVNYYLRPPVRLPAAKLYIEHNGTAADTGVHGLFDGTDWRQLYVHDPNGRLILSVSPKRQLRTQSMSGIFFESAEPPNSEVPIAEILRRFPEGQYQVSGQTADGSRLTGAATFTHNIPAIPVITFPADESTVPATNLTVRWNHVTQTLDGRPLLRTGYEVILTKDGVVDPNGFSAPALSIHVPPSVTSLTVPNQFLERNSRYEIEIIVLETSGNQTIASLFFQTGS